MPNWVTNTLTISGEDTERIASVKKMLAQPHEVIEDDGSTTTVEKEFSFWNIKSPDPSTYAEYFGTQGYANGEAVGNTAGNWYNWNCENWGCKWDASSVELHRDSDENRLVYYFHTPWSPMSTDLLLLLSEKYPTLTMVYDYEEEQGWGGEIEVQGGEVNYIDEYDIPQSHADLDARDRDCWACDSGDPEWMWDDCPEKEAWEKIDEQWVLIG